MSWITPKTDWATDDVIATTDLNRIESNTECALLGHGGTLVSLTAAINLDITITTDIFYITGDSDINYIKKTDRLCGAKIYLIFDSSPDIRLNEASAGDGYAKIVGKTGDSILYTSAGQVKAFIYDGTQWRWLTDNT